MVTKSGYGELLFKDVRGECFALDQADAKGASIMVVGTNFGCGSSREHAVWAIQQAGFKAVIAKKLAGSPGYSDIFRQNSANCGLLLIEIDAEPHKILEEAGSGARVTLDLPAQTIKVGAETLRFEINEGTKAAVMEGLDLIGTTLRHESDIAGYEARDVRFVPHEVAS